MSSTDQKKHDQRVHAKNTRLLAFQNIDQAGEMVCAAWNNHQTDLPKNQIISIYWPLGDELDPLPLLNALHKAGHTMVLPVMLGAEKPLIFKTWQPGDTLKSARFGTKEPTDDKPTLDPDIILAPLLAFDRHGYRLGYGGGFYDRTLEKLRAHKPVSVYGVGFVEQEVELVVRGEYDQPLDGMITPQGMVEF